MKNGPKIFEKSQKTFKKLLKITFVQKLLTHPLLLSTFLGRLNQKEKCTQIRQKMGKKETKMV